MIRYFRVFGLLAVAAVSACGAEILLGDVWRAGAADEFAAAAGGRDMRTLIIGNPFTEAKATVDAAITDAMQGHNYGPPTNFTTRPGPSAAKNYRITILFNPPPAIGPNSMCGETDALSAEDRGERLRLLAVFCSHGDPMSYVYGSTAAANSAADPAVRHLMASVTRELVPPSDHLLPGSPPLPGF